MRRRCFNLTALPVGRSDCLLHWLPDIRTRHRHFIRRQQVTAAGESLQLPKRVEARIDDAGSSYLKLHWFLLRALWGFLLQVLNKGKHTEGRGPEEHDECEPSTETGAH